MPSGTFNQWGPADKAKKLKIDGKWIWPDKRCNLDGIEPGMQVEFEMSYGGSDGKLPILTKIWPKRASNGAPAPAGTAIEVSPLDDSGMRFVSNLVGSAIMAGKVDKPYELSTWTVAARRAFAALQKPENGLDDDLGTEREPGSDDENPGAGMPSNW